MLGAVLALATAGAAAQTVCRPNALGEVVCSGGPVLTGDGPPLGIDAAKPPLAKGPAAGAGQPLVISPGRTNAFGDVILRESDTRDISAQQHCKRDNLGNLVCR